MMLYLDEGTTLLYSSACKPAVRLSCARCRAPEISHNKGNAWQWIYENVAPKALNLPTVPR